MFQWHSRFLRVFLSALTSCDQQGEATSFYSLIPQTTKWITDKLQTLSEADLHLGDPQMILENCWHSKALNLSTAALPVSEAVPFSSELPVIPVTICVWTTHCFPANEPAPEATPAPDFLVSTGATTEVVPEVPVCPDMTAVDSELPVCFHITMKVTPEHPVLLDQSWTPCQPCFGQGAGFGFWGQPVWALC